MPAVGYFTDDSVIRHVHRERVMALAGPRALLLMAAHPVAFEGFFAQTTSLEEPYERLARTGELLGLITYGPREPARKATARVRSLHATVRGTIPETAGRFPAGTPYAADDPELLLWILASLFDSNLLIHDRYIGNLRGAEREAYWQDFRTIGKLFGLRMSEMPRDLPEFHSYMSEMLQGPDIHVTDRARELGVRIVLHPPVPLAARPLLELANFVTAGLLPARLREGYRLSWDPARSLALFGHTQYARRLLMPLLPSPVRRFRPRNETAAPA